MRGAEHISAECRDEAAGCQAERTIRPTETPRPAVLNSERR